MPTRATPRTCSKARVTSPSSHDDGARNSPTAATGSGSRLRSSLPEMVSGTVSSTMIVVGTM